MQIKAIGAYDKGIYRFEENTISVILPFDKIQIDAQVNAQVDAQVNAQVGVSTPQVGGQTPQVDTPVDTPVDKKAALIPPYENKSDYAARILKFCQIPRGILEIAKHLKYKQKKSVRKHLIPLVEQGRLAMTVPDKPNSRFQKYVSIK